MTRRTKDESREVFLTTGAEMLLEAAKNASPFAMLKLTNVCARAGYTTGAFYFHWPSIEAYRSALAEFLLTDDSVFGSDKEKLKAAVAHLQTEGTPEEDPLAAITHVADLDLRLLLKNKHWDAMELLTITWGRTQFSDETVAGYRSTDEWTMEVYGALIESIGRELIPGVSHREVGMLLQSLIEGFGLRAKVDSDLRPNRKGRISSYALGVASIIVGTTRKKGDERTLETLLEDRLRG